MKLTLQSIITALTTRFGRPILEKVPNGYRFGWRFSDPQPGDVDHSVMIGSESNHIKVGAIVG